jgi:hypothetical protein
MTAAAAPPAAPDAAEILAATRPADATLVVLLAEHLRRLSDTAVMSSADVAALNRGRAAGDALVALIREGGGRKLLLAAVISTIGRDDGRQLGGLLDRLQEHLAELLRKREGTGVLTNPLKHDQATAALAEACAAEDPRWAEARNLLEQLRAADAPGTLLAALIRFMQGLLACSSPPAPGEGGQ